MRIRALLPGLLTVVAAAQSVHSVDGNLFLSQGDGKTVQLLGTGRDSMPSLSSDGKKVAFVRSRDDLADDLCIIDLNGPSPTNVLPFALVQKYGISRIFDPQFSPDSSAIYFYAEPGNFGLIVRVNLTSGEAIVIAHTLAAISKRKSFDVIEHGKYEGDLVVYKDSQKLTAGRLFLYWLINSLGEDVAIIADNETDLSVFRSEHGLDDRSN